SVSQAFCAVFTNESGRSGRRNCASRPQAQAFLRRARELGAFINFDMESYAHKNTTLELFKTLLTEDDLRDWAHAGIVIQAYLRDSEGDLRDLIAWGRKRGTRFAVRLVKGAYWDYETTKSLQNGWTCPVYFQKPQSDANFETLTRLLLENDSIVTAAFGSHNVRSIAHAQALAEEFGIDRSRFEFQLLYGMAGPIKRALVEMGYRVREYCPVGELLPGMAYLVRRLLENTMKSQTTITTQNQHRQNSGLVDTASDDVYRNSPLVNFVYKDSQDKMRSA